MAGLRGLGAGEPMVPRDGRGDGAVPCFPAHSCSLPPAPAHPRLSCLCLSGEELSRVLLVLFRLTDCPLVLIRRWAAHRGFGGAEHPAHTSHVCRKLPWRELSSCTLNHGLLLSYIRQQLLITT